MCTSIALNTLDFYFGRNLDLEMGLGEQVVIAPRHYPFVFRQAGESRAHYAMVGMAMIREAYPLYFDAINEKGLAMAGLNFPGNAWYDPCVQEKRLNVSPFELIPFVLGQCSDTEQARQLLARVHLIALPFSEEVGVSPLHWHIADESGSIVLECTREGMKIHENPAGVLTNNPPFDFHMLNLSQYQQLSPLPPQNRLAPQADLSPFGRGMGAMGLPGDYSPASRFVRGAFLRAHSVCQNRAESAVPHFFHLLAGMAMPRGAVILEGNQPEITQYACCMQKKGCVYYYQTYENSRVTAISLTEERAAGEKLQAFPLRRKWDAVWE